MDSLSGLCIGCGRSREEIAAWLTLGETERKAIMAELEERLVAARSRKSRGRAFSRGGG